MFVCVRVCCGIVFERLCCGYVCCCFGCGVVESFVFFFLRLISAVRCVRCVVCILDFFCVESLSLCFVFG